MLLAFEPPQVVEYRRQKQELAQKLRDEAASERARLRAIEEEEKRVDDVTMDALYDSPERGASVESVSSGCRSVPPTPVKVAPVKAAPVKVAPAKSTPVKRARSPRRSHKKESSDSEDQGGVVREIHSRGRRAKQEHSVESKAESVRRAKKSRKSRKHAKRASKSRSKGRVSKSPVKENPRWVEPDRSSRSLSRGWQGRRGRKHKNSTGKRESPKAKRRKERPERGHVKDHTSYRSRSGGNKVRSQERAKHRSVSSYVAHAKDRERSVVQERSLSNRNRSSSKDLPRSLSPNLNRSLSRGNRSLSGGLSKDLNYGDVSDGLECASTGQSPSLIAAINRSVSEGLNRSLSRGLERRRSESSDHYRAKDRSSSSHRDPPKERTPRDRSLSHQDPPKDRSPSAGRDHEDRDNEGADKDLSYQDGARDRSRSNGDHSVSSRSPRNDAAEKQERSESPNLKGRRARSASGSFERVSAPQEESEAISDVGAKHELIKNDAPAETAKEEFSSDNFQEPSSSDEQEQPSSQALDVKAELSSEKKNRRSRSASREDGEKRSTTPDRRSPSSRLSSVSLPRMKRRSVSGSQERSPARSLYSCGSSIRQVRHSPRRSRSKSRTGRRRRREQPMRSRSRSQSRNGKKGPYLGELLHNGRYMRGTCTRVVKDFAFISTREFRQEVFVHSKNVLNGPITPHAECEFRVREKNDRISAHDVTVLSKNGGDNFIGRFPGEVASCDRGRAYVFVRELKENVRVDMKEKSSIRVGNKVSLDVVRDGSVLVGRSVRSLGRVTRGEIIRWREGRDYGFAKCEAVPDDIFVHTKDLDEGFKYLRVGQRIEFLLEQTGPGKYHARQVRRMRESRR